MKQDDALITTLHEFKSVFMRQSMHNAMRYSRDSGCSMSQLGTLMTIHRHGTLTVSDIGEELGVSNAAASQMLDRLVQDGLIFRTEDPDDRRVKQIDLTEKGLDILQQGLQARHRWIEEMAAGLSSSEQEKIVEGLKILIKTAEKFPHEENSE